MLQQTQVSRVLEKFAPFMERFPTVARLAKAEEGDVLAAWSGLGYYRRARLLHGCAKAIVERFGGEVPRGAEVLLSLPGIGRYTAGAIASIVFGEAAAIVDGNVCRVLQRLEAKSGHAGEKRIVEWAWKRSEGLVELTVKGKGRRGAGDAAAFNEGLMELGATVCTPSSPKCGVCPLRELCKANERGLQETIPGAKPRAARENVHHHCVVVRTSDGRILVEQRPAKGLWASMWQAPTVERDTPEPFGALELSKALGLKWLKTSHFERATPMRSVFHTTHRAVHFSVWQATAREAFEPGTARRWVMPEVLGSLALANAHRQLLLTS